MSRQFVISLTTLKRTEGASKDFHCEGSFDDPIEVGLTSLPAGNSLRVDGTLQSVGDGVLMSGVLVCSVDFQCSRCLQQGSQTAEIPVQELFIYPEKQTQYDDEDVRFITEESIDLTDTIRDALILDQPLSPLCTPDCRGLCQECGADLNADPDHDHGDGVDSRWLTLTEWGKMS